jgi:hypothetical protein
MTDFPGWHQDPTGRHPERYFDSNGLPTQLVRSGEHEFTDADALPSAPPLFAYPSVPPPAPYDPPTLQVPAVPPPVPARPTRSRKWRLIGAACLVGVLLVAAITAAVQERGDANTWKHNAQTEQTKYQKEAHAAQSLYATLVSTKQQLATVTNQKNTAVNGENTLSTALQDAGSIASYLGTCVDDIDTMLNDISSSIDSEAVDPSLEPDATTAGDVCRQAQSENATLQQDLSGG